MNSLINTVTHLPTETHPLHPPETSATSGLPHFHRLIDAEGVCWLTFDSPRSKANVWNADSLKEFNSHLEAIEHNPEVKALVLQSAKDGIFIAGADLKAIRSQHGDRVRELIWLGQGVFERLAHLPIPKVALIHGACAGGGYEVTLACDWRLASDHRSTKIGLPETQLGILPAWGGSTRLPQLIGLSKALRVITGGQLMSAKAALKSELVDEVVPREHLAPLARRYLQKERGKSYHWENYWPLSNVIAHMAKQKVRQKTRGLYPAILKAVDVAARGVNKPTEEGLRLERDAVDVLVRRPETRHLIDLFFRREEAAKKQPTMGTVLPVHEAVVVGAGVMGAGIAEVIASKGVQVLMADVSTEALAHGLGRIQEMVNEGVKRRVWTPTQGRDVMDHITPEHQSVPLHRYHLVIEAATENMELKKRLFQDLAARTAPDAILATNTSALSVEELAQTVPHPERVIGLHFFNPAHRMPLVEVVVLPETSPDVIATAIGFVQRLGKTPVVVQDSPGFVVNRILMPYLMEAVKLHNSGVPAQLIDEAMLDFGMPMGPIRLLDEIGLDVAAHVSRTLSAAYPDRLPHLNTLEQMVTAGRLGRKSGRGFYDYPLPRNHIPAFNITDEHLKDTVQLKLALLLSNEAARCLKEGVAASVEDIDLAMVLGTGYPAFRGGPLTWLDDIGHDYAALELRHFSHGLAGPHSYEPAF